MGIDDIVLGIVSAAIVVMIGVIKKIWTSLDTYFDKKAENMATRQDIIEITSKTEQVQADFHKILGKFDADLKFKYEFYEKQYTELYSILFRMICESESLRYILARLANEQMTFADFPIIEYDKPNTRREEQEAEKAICKKILNLIMDKYAYASPPLLKLAAALINIGEYEEKIDSEERKKLLEHQLKAEIVKTSLKDYYWLRNQLHLQESEDESETVEAGTFIPIALCEK